MSIKIVYKEAFAVIGKAGQGSANNPSEWISPLWQAANANFAEISGIIRKSESGAPLVWGAMNDVNEQNRRWSEVGKYMAGCEADIDAVPPSGWTKWIIPTQSYMVAECTSDQYGEVFGNIASDPNIQIIATVHERYPQPGNPDMLELWFPVAYGDKFCQLCGMQITKPSDIGTEADGTPSTSYCCHCYKGGSFENATPGKLIADVKALANIEVEYPGLLSSPLLNYIQNWLSLVESHKVTDALPELLSALIDGQDCDLANTQWEKGWLADGKVCHCLACNAARQCISDIKLMMGGAI